MSPEPDALRILRTAYGLYRATLAAPSAPAKLEEPPHVDLVDGGVGGCEDPDLPREARHG